VAGDDGTSGAVVDAVAPVTSAALGGSVTGGAGVVDARGVRFAAVAFLGTVFLAGGGAAVPASAAFALRCVALPGDLAAAAFVGATAAGVAFVGSTDASDPADASGFAAESP
jgi:hypothetical protein